MDAGWFQAALERAGASQADLARHLRLAPSAISRMVKGERQMKLTEAVQVAAFLGASQEDVLRYAGAEAPASPAPMPSRRGRPPRLAKQQFPALRSETAAIPIRSAADSGAGLVLAEGPVGYTSRPPNLNGIRDGYAIYMVGESMRPRYEQGWLLHVNPFKPPSPGRDVVVLKQGEAVVIGQFVSWEADALVLRQLNPPEELRIPRADVIGCHLIVGVDQEG
jgi:phage repressor protein C with HTH and peptisase S24 domain